MPRSGERSYRHLFIEQSLVSVEPESGSRAGKRPVAPKIQNRGGNDVSSVHRVMSGDFSMETTGTGVLPGGWIRPSRKSFAEPQLSSFAPRKNAAIEPRSSARRPLAEHRAGILLQFEGREQDRLKWLREKGLLFGKSRPIVQASPSSAWLSRRRLRHSISLLAISSSYPRGAGW